MCARSGYASRPLPRSLLLASAFAVATAAPAGVARADGFTYTEEPAPAPSATPTPSSPPVDAFEQRGGYDVELGARGGFGSAPIRGGNNPFGVALGGRLGLAIGGFYVGVTAVDFLGGNDVDLSDSAVLYGVELGYGLRYRVFSVGALTLRPLIGVGNATFFHTDPSQAKVDVVTSASGQQSRGVTSDTTTVNNVYVEPGLLVMLASGHNFAALSASVAIFPGISYAEPQSTTWVSYGLQAHLGFKF